MARRVRPWRTKACRLKKKKDEFNRRNRELKHVLAQNVVFVPADHLPDLHDRNRPSSNSYLFSFKAVQLRRA
jgi:hypothetical protein